MAHLAAKGFHFIVEKLLLEFFVNFMHLDWLVRFVAVSIQMEFPADETSLITT
jgi:hypothetical protein